MMTANRTMIVYHADGQQYFRTSAVSPANEVHEQDYWEAQGYQIEYLEPNQPTVKEPA